MIARRRPSFASLWRADRRGVAAVEFAFTVPVLLVIYLAGFELSQAMATYRKMSDLTVELANVAAQYTTMSSTDVTSVFNASTQVMAPYSTASLNIILTEIDTNDSNVATVRWSQCNTGCPTPAAGSPATLPAGLSTKDTSYVLVQTSYLYTPVVGANLIPQIPMNDQIYMLPRASSSIPYTG